MWTYCTPENEENREWSHSFLSFVQESRLLFFSIFNMNIWYDVEKQKERKKETGALTRLKESFTGGKSIEGIKSIVSNAGSAQVTMCKLVPNSNLNKHIFANLSCLTDRANRKQYMSCVTLILQAPWPDFFTTCQSAALVHVDLYFDRGYKTIDRHGRWTKLCGMGVQVTDAHNHRCSNTTQKHTMTNVTCRVWLWRKPYRQPYSLLTEEAMLMSGFDTW